MPMLSPFQLQKLILKECFFHLLLSIEEIHDFVLNLMVQNCIKLKVKVANNESPSKITYLNTAASFMPLSLHIYMCANIFFFYANEIML